MAMGKREAEQQQDLFVTHDRLPRSPGHVFYRKLNRLLTEGGFDLWIEALCEPHYCQGVGRPSVPPGVYFRMLLVGYFEGINSQRGIAWRCSDWAKITGPLVTVLHSQSLAAGGLPRDVRLGAVPPAKEKAAQGEDGGRRFHDAGSRRGHEEHRPQG